MLLLAATLILIELDVITFAYERLGLHHRTALALLFATLLGSVINVPVAHLRDQTVISDRIVSAFGVRYVIPVVEDWPGTVIAVNLGGALLPLVLSVYLSRQVGHVPQLALVAVLVAAVTHHFARVEPGVGVVVPVIVPPLAAALLAWFIAPDVRAAAAFVGGTIGTLVGADLLNLGGMRGSGAAVASIGGAGTFDGIFVTGIVAVLLA
jgi:uncharacterized membrane protein